MVVGGIVAPVHHANEKLRRRDARGGALRSKDCKINYLEAGAGVFATDAGVFDVEAGVFTAGAGFTAGLAMVAVPPGAGFLLDLTFFTGGFLVLVTTAELPGFGVVLAAGGFWAANMVVEAIAKAIVSIVFFMAFSLPGEPFCSLALLFHSASDGQNTR
jgi:hypothetical protein